MMIDAKPADKYNPETASTAGETAPTQLGSRTGDDDASPINVRIIWRHNDLSIKPIIGCVGTLLLFLLAMHVLNFDQHYLNLFKHLFGHMYVGPLRQADLYSMVLLTESFLKIIPVYAIFDFFILRPGRRQERERKAMLQRSA